MADSYGIDSHKLMYHPARVTKWLEGNDIYPLTVEISPSGACNHRCSFCAFDYLGYKPAFLEREKLLANLSQMAEGGVKSIVVAGEGEPLLHPQIESIVEGITEAGMDCSLVSNGVLLNEEKAATLLPHLTWARFSVNAGSPETHHKIHQGKAEDFSIVLENLRRAVLIKKKGNLSVTLGVQMLMLPDNWREVKNMALTLQDVGVDYFTVKPYSQHPKSINQAADGFSYKDMLDLEKELEMLSTPGYQVIFRAHSMEKLCQARRYKVCHGISFWAYVDATGNLWPCLAYVGDEKFLMGNIQQKSFREIWQGVQRKKVLEYINAMDLTDCRELCRLDEMNAYLEKLKHPSGHVNFI